MEKEIRKNERRRAYRLREKKRQQKISSISKERRDTNGSFHETKWN